MSCQCRVYVIVYFGGFSLRFTMTLLLFGALCFAVFVVPAMVFAEAQFGPGDTRETMVIVALGLLAALPFIAIGMFAFYQAIANTVRALSDKRVHYPLSIQFLK